VIVESIVSMSDRDVDDESGLSASDLRSGHGGYSPAPTGRLSHQPPSAKVVHLSGAVRESRDTFDADVAGVGEKTVPRNSARGDRRCRR
jgi:hypothetical protein